eukprot:TRINITY_DN28835_c0_g1_i2.p1 TRINITY_DN28835_c0_g1~~TRINITY_DN28835_c0_g1_i2.p1  ORF type:complete len:1002 (+),score=294.92 TRINITY_DN28835_c0_g1_i2:55-3060(+)
MILKVIFDEEFRTSVGPLVSELVWTVNGAQPFVDSLPTLKRKLGITASFHEDGYDLLSVRQTGDEPLVDQALDVSRSPDQCGLRSGMTVCVRRLRVARLITDVHIRELRCSEPLRVVVRGTDIRGNARPLPPGGRVRLLLTAGDPSTPCTGTLLGHASQGSGDGVQTEFTFPGLRIDTPGDYRVRAELVHPSAPPVQPGVTAVLRVRAEPHPIVTDTALQHVGLHALRFACWVDRPGLLYWAAYAAGTEPEGLPSEILRTAARDAIEVERERAVMRYAERPTHQGEGREALPGSISAGVSELHAGCQAFDVPVRLVEGGSYTILFAPDNSSHTNVAVEVRSLRVAVGPDTGVLAPCVSNLSLDCTSGGVGGLRVAFDAIDAGSLHYVVARHGDYIPQAPAEFALDATVDGRQPYTIIANGSLPIGPGIGHSMFLHTPGVAPGELIDFWWVPMQLRRNPRQPLEIPQRKTVLVPHEDPPQVLSFAVIPSYERLGVHIKAEVDYPGLLHYVVMRPGEGHLLLPAALRKLTTQDGPGGDVVATGSHPLVSAGTHTFQVTFPVPVEHAEAQRCTPDGFRSGCQYEVYYLADSRSCDNPATRVSQCYTVTLPLHLHRAEEDAGEPTLDSRTDVSEQRQSFSSPVRPCPAAAVEPTIQPLPTSPRDFLAPRPLPRSEFREGSPRPTDIGALYALMRTDSPERDSAAGIIRSAAISARQRGVMDQDVVRQAVMTQQRILDLESTLRQCNTALIAAQEEKTEYEGHLRELREEADRREELLRGLENWRDQHLELQKADTERECRELAAGCEEVAVGNQLWEERVRELRERNDALTRVAATAEQRRKDFVAALKERCVRHSAELHRIPDRTTEVLELREVRDEQDAEIEALTALLSRLKPPPPPKEEERSRLHTVHQECREPEPCIVTRRLSLPKGGLRVLMTVRGSGLQALRFKHNVTAEVVSLGQDHNELHVTGESGNVLKMLREVEALYEEYKMQLAPPSDVPAEVP